MKKEVLFLAFLVGTILSCKTDQQIEAAAQKRAEENFKQLSLNTVDRYPLFENCDEMITTPDCFYRELHKLVTDKLATQIYDYKWTTQDSLVAAITVKSSGQITYDSLVNVARKYDKIELDRLFKNQLTPLCKIEPAIFQGIPVTTSYLLPIKIKAAPQPD